MDCKDRLEAYLREKRVPFEVRHHPRAITAQEVAASEHVPGKMLAAIFERPLIPALVTAVVAIVLLIAVHVVWLNSRTAPMPPRVG